MAEGAHRVERLPAVPADAATYQLLRSGSDRVRRLEGVTYEAQEPTQYGPCWRRRPAVWGAAAICAGAACAAVASTSVRGRQFFRGRTGDTLVNFAETCHTAQPGEACYLDVMWAKTTGILEKPEWYPGLNKDASFEAFQASKGLQGYTDCKGIMPCEPEPSQQPTSAPAPAMDGPCETAVFGSDCYNRVMWVLRSGIGLHPDWYPTLDFFSSFEEIQQVLFERSEQCSTRPCPAARNTFPRFESVSLDPVCNSLTPAQALGVPDAWALAPTQQDKCFEDMHAIRQQGVLSKDTFVVKEDKVLMRGRNWCWVGFKEFGCHRSWSDHLTWRDMQDLASKQHITLPLGFQPIQAPDICDKRENGATRDWTQAEQDKSRAWLQKYVSVYVLSLPGSPRRPGVQKCLDTLGIEFSFVDGIDLRKPGALWLAQNEGLVPQKFNFERAQAKGYSEGQNMAAAGSLIGTVGCAAAHFKAQRAELKKPQAERKPIVLIFEDDTCPERDFIPKLWSLVQEELPCDWEAVSLYSRCPFGRCVSPRLTRVQPDTNEPMWRCRHGVNWGFQGMLYRTETVESLQAKWQPIVFDEEKPNCLYLDNALAAISDSVVFYAVPAAQSPGFLRELDYSGSERVKQGNEVGYNPWKSCATYGCHLEYRHEDACQCNERCIEFNNCCHDYEAHCENPGPSLFCFTVMRPFGYEQQLVERQLASQAGVFACNAFSVFSSHDIQLSGPQLVHTSVVASDLQSDVSQQGQKLLNTKVFMQVWQKVFSENTFADYDWTVKADPDTVFIPGRLVEHLRLAGGDTYPHGREDAVYLLNCGLGLHGPLEVLSQKATVRFQDGGLQECVDNMVTDWTVSGEDEFVAQCWARLGIEHITDFGLLDDRTCGGSVSPCLSGKVAFHAFRDADSWAQCLSEAQR